MGRRQRLVDTKKASSIKTDLAHAGLEPKPPALPAKDKVKRPRGRPRKEVPIVVSPEAARELTDIQIKVIPLLVQGLMNTEISRRLGVSCPQISTWLHHDDAFAAELSRLKIEAYNANVQRAFDVMRNHMDSKDPKQQFQAANAVIRHQALLALRTQTTTVRLEGVERLRNLLRDDQPVIDAQYTTSSEQQN